MAFCQGHAHRYTVSHYRVPIDVVFSGLWSGPICLPPFRRLFCILLIWWDFIALRYRFLSVTLGVSWPRLSVDLHRALDGNASMYLALRRLAALPVSWVISRRAQRARERTTACANRVIYPLLLLALLSFWCAAKCPSEGPLLQA